MLYLFNSLIIPVNFDAYGEVKISLRRISVEEARKIIDKEGKFISAIGHESTARILSILLGIDVPFERKAVFMEPGDKGIHFFLKERLPEGTILSYEEISKKDFWLVYSEIEESQ